MLQFVEESPDLGSRVDLSEWEEVKETSTQLATGHVKTQSPSKMCSLEHHPKEHKILTNSPPTKSVQDTMWRSGLQELYPSALESICIYSIHLSGHLFIHLSSAYVTRSFIDAYMYLSSIYLSYIIYLSTIIQLSISSQPAIYHLSINKFF